MHDEFGSLPVLLRGSLPITFSEVAFSKVECDLVERALFPLFCFCQPKNFAFGIQQGALAADKFLLANFDQPVHELHSCDVKPIYLATLAGSPDRSLFNLPGGGSLVVRAMPLGIAAQQIEPIYF
jgi:hypothetical protein